MEDTRRQFYKLTIIIRMVFMQVLCYCPGFKRGVKQLCDVISKRDKEDKEHAAENKVHSLFLIRAFFFFLDSPSFICPSCVWFIMLVLQESKKDDLPASYEVIRNLSSLIHSTEHLQVSYLLNPENYDTELAAQPRRLLTTLRYDILHACKGMFRRWVLHRWMRKYSG